MKKIYLLLFFISAINISYSQSITNQFYNVVGGNGNGIRFWNQDNYKLHMGNSAEYKYGSVAGHSIKFNMANEPTWGWTWGIHNQTPIAALNTQGRFQIENDFISLGRLGVGTTQPASLAHFVFKQNHTTFGATASYLVLSNANTTPQNLSGIAFSSNAEGTGTSLISARHNRDTNNSGRLILYNRNSGGGFYPGLTIKEDNTVGIGTTEPDKTLTLQAATATYLNIKTNTRELLIGTDHNGGVISAMTNDDLYLRTGGNINRMVIKANGNVGIGTNDPGQDMLAVNGPIKARAVKVSIDGWSDFVFEEDYKLRSLIEVEDFIKENKHLPEIPSAKEVEENGVNLGAMDAKLLQKIEELTLYLIEQNRKIETLQKEILELKK